MLKSNIIQNLVFKNKVLKLVNLPKLFIDASIIFTSPATSSEFDAPPVLHKLQNPNQSKILILVVLFVT